MKSSIEQSISNGESNILEFKEKPNADIKKYLKTVVAFSNSKGGRIIFGVSDNGDVIGIDGDHFRIMDEITDRIVSEVVPTPVFNIGAPTIKGKTVLVLSIEPGTNRPYHYRKEGENNGTYVRINATSRICSPEFLTELRLQGRNTSADCVEEIASELSVDDPELKKLCAYASEHSRREFGISQLMNEGLVNRHSDIYVPTRGYYMLTSNPYDHARIEMARFRGSDRTAMIDKKTCNGSLIEQIECAQNFVLNHISFIPRIDGIYRSDEPEIPIPVLRECIVNAVAHRSYALIDSPIFVAVYDDSIEITSPGTLPYGLNIEDLMEGISRPRNRAIVRFFKAVGIMEGWGCGVSRMMALCTENGLHKPMVEEVGENVRVTIYRKNAVIPGEVPVKFNKVQEKIAYFIISNPGCRLEDVSSGTGIPRSTVNKAVSEMKTMGKLRRKGSKKTGEWILEEYPMKPETDDVTMDKKSNECS